MWSVQIPEGYRVCLRSSRSTIQRDVATRDRAASAPATQQRPGSHRPRSFRALGRGCEAPAEWPERRGHIRMAWRNDAHRRRRRRFCHCSLDRDRWQCAYRGRVHGRHGRAFRQRRSWDGCGQSRVQPASARFQARGRSAKLLGPFLYSQPYDEERFASRHHELERRYQARPSEPAGWLMGCKSGWPFGRS
jgi:hypothetical protein